MIKSKAIMLLISLPEMLLAATREKENWHLASDIKGRFMIMLLADMRTANILRIRPQRCPETSERRRVTIRTAPCIHRTGDERELHLPQMKDQCEVVRCLREQQKQRLEMRTRLMQLIKSSVDSKWLQMLRESIRQ